MSLKKEIEKEQTAHQSMAWDQAKTGGAEKNVGQVTGTGGSADSPTTQGVGSNGSIGGKDDEDAEDSGA